jgi:predicted transcriptional regulator
LLELQIKEILKQRSLKPVDVYKALNIDKVVFYQSIRTSNLNNKTLHKILRYLGLEMEVKLHEKEILNANIKPHCL